MPSDEPRPSELPDERPVADDTPPIEDAYESESVSEGDTPEDDPDQFVDSGRYLEDDTVEAVVEVVPEALADAGVARPDIDDEPADDAGYIPEAAESDETEPGETLNWDATMSPHKVVVELKRIETQVRELLEGRDGRRKRKLSGTRRWRELEEDILAWRHSGRVDEAALARLQQLIVKRDYLFRRLRFLAGTRPTWNT